MLVNGSGGRLAFGFWRGRFGVFVMSPLLHGVLHGENLPLKLGAAGAHGHVQTQRQAVLPGQCAILPRNHERGDFFAGFHENHCVALGVANQFNSRHSRNLRRARCNWT